MRLSRWGLSPYETAKDIEIEANGLAPFVSIVDPRADAEIVVIHSKITFGVLELAQSPSTRLVVTTTSGTDHIDRECMASRGIVVARLPEARRDAVVDATIGMLIWGLRRRGILEREARQGVWARDQLSSFGPVGLRDCTVGIVGLGVIGRQLATVLTALGCRMVGMDPKGVPDGMGERDLKAMLDECDAITFHCDLNSTSLNMLSAERLHQARRGLVIVNTARGGLVDVNAAIRALQDGQLGALALDVFPEEPFPQMASMASHPQLLFTPHSAGYHTMLPEKIRRGICRAVSAFVAGEPVPYKC
jgi:phosphoglycerate dehydrogenase-like enzyme